MATASLHQRYPEREDFDIGEIVAQAEAADLTGAPLRRGVKVHAYSHCVANRPPNPGRYRMLFETGKGRRRLYRPSDPCHPMRAGGKDLPRRDELPEGQRDLLDWYGETYVGRRSESVEDPILALRGVGKSLWADEDADEYVRRQRKGWQ